MLNFLTARKAAAAVIPQLERPVLVEELVKARRTYAEQLPVLTAEARAAEAAATAAIAERDRAKQALHNLGYQFERTVQNCQGRLRQTSSPVIIEELQLFWRLFACVRALPVNSELDITTRADGVVEVSRQNRRHSMQTCMDSVRAGISRLEVLQLQLRTEPEVLADIAEIRGGLRLVREAQIVLDEAAGRSKLSATRAADEAAE